MRELVYVILVWFIACGLVDLQRWACVAIVASDEMQQQRENEAAAAWHKEAYGW